MVRDAKKEPPTRLGHLTDPSRPPRQRAAARHRDARERRGRFRGGDRIGARIVGFGAWFLLVGLGRALKLLSSARLVGVFFLFAAFWGKGVHFKSKGKPMVPWVCGLKSTWIILTSLTDQKWCFPQRVKDPLNGMGKSERPCKGIWSAAFFVAREHCRPVSRGWHGAHWGTR